MKVGDLVVKVEMTGKNLLACETRGISMKSTG